MNRTGVHHLGLATLDIDRTVEFYTTKLGWTVAWCDILEPSEGGKIKHVFNNVKAEGHADEVLAYLKSAA